VAEDVAATAPLPAVERPASEGPAPSRAERARSSAYYSRFSLAFMLLIMLGVGAVGALVLVLRHPDAARGPAWSKFKPTGSTIAMERQIATKVSSEYKASTASGLVSVFPGLLQQTSFIQTDSGPTSVETPVSSVAVRPDVSTGQHEEGDFTFFSPGSTIAYEMCAFGSTQQNCGIATLPGANPAALLHREALELALYTLKYVPGTDAVITYLPPPANTQGATANAVFFGRKDVKRNLKDPLARTLKPQQVLLGTGVPDAGRIGALTKSHVYTPDYQTLPGDGSAILVLTPAITAAG
jgi:hypothetical protein